MRLPRMLAALLFPLVLAASPAAPAQAAAIGVTTSADELNSDGDCSLREAIRAANLNAAVDACPAGDGADTIALPAGVYTLAIAGYDDAALAGDFDITDSLTITGALSTTTVIDGGALDAVFDIVGSTAMISGLTVRNGDLGGISNRGGALTVVDSTISGNRYDGIRSSGALTITQSLIANNSNSGIESQGRAVISGSTIRDNNLSNPIDSSGGGIYNNGSMLLTNSSVISNTASRGGGIATSGSLTVTYSLISDNLASLSIGGGSNEAGVGGGIFSSASMLIVEHSSILRNQAINHAGGIYSEGAAYITNTTIANNGAIGRNGGTSAWAGGIDHRGMGTMTLTDSVVRGNTATDYAGGILAQDTLVIDGTSIISNSAGFSGGGIFSHGHTTITRSLIHGNTAINGGGIIDIAAPGQRRLTLVSDSIISGNSAMRGGGINSSGHVQITSSALISNTATEDGGGIYNNRFASYTNALTATNSTISGNSAGRHGGGLYSITGTLSLYNATIAHNTADFDNDGTGDGGGLMRGSGTVALQNSILGANSDRGGQAGDCAGALLSQGYNLLQDTSGCTLTGTTDILGQPPLLGPLAENGGPTPTHALLPGSPALDAADPADCRDAEGALLTVDQRGEPRPVGSACDIGAFEAALAPQIATTTALSSSGSPTSVGQTIIFTAIVSATAGIPTGSVTFKDGATILGSVALVAGQASFNSAGLAVGQHGITAAYSGDATFQASVSSALAQQVDKLGSAVTLDASASPSAFGQAVTFTATVQLGASDIPIGTVTFRDGATILGTSTVDNDGRASFSTALLALGEHSITAAYSGDASFLGSVSSPLAHQVHKASATIAITTSAQPSLLGQTVVFTITVSTDGVGAPTGTVTLKDGAIVLGSGALVGGHYVFTTSALTPGEHQITVEYSGDTQFEPATSSAMAHTVLVPVYLPLVAGP